MSESTVPWLWTSAETEKKYLYVNSGNRALGKLLVMRRQIVVHIKDLHQCFISQSCTKFPCNAGSLVRRPEISGLSQ